MKHDLPETWWERIGYEFASHPILIFQMLNRRPAGDAPLARGAARRLREGRRGDRRRRPPRDRA